MHREIVLESDLKELAYTTVKWTIKKLAKGISYGQTGTGVLYRSRLFGRILKSFLSRLLEARFMGDGSGGQGSEPPVR
jgi:hypothetical protein